MIRASIAGASGYAGGELLRLLLGHPEVEVGEITSERLAGKFAHGAHPNLRGRTALRFSTLESLSPCDALFVCLPHGESARRMEGFRRLAPRIVDLGADFRLPDPALWERAWGAPHSCPSLLGRFIYGIPELNREALREADLAAGAGCNATAVILALRPLTAAGLVESAVVEVLVGSSEAGVAPTAASHHPERSGAARAFRPTGHRHRIEAAAALGLADLHFSATSIGMVRGVLATCHAFLKRGLDDRALWRLYREASDHEPFLRIVKARSGIHRYPDPKILAGTNFCDLGFERDPDTNRVVVMSALDNLMKGAAGQAVQAFNLMHGLPETSGLEFAGLHPI